MKTIKSSRFLLVLASSVLLVTACGTTKSSQVSKPESSIDSQEETFNQSVAPISSEPASSEETLSSKKPLSSYDWPSAPISPDEVDETTWTPTGQPDGFNITYYTNIYSRGFSYLTSNAATSGELYLVKGNSSEDSAFASVTPIACESVGHSSNSYYLHQAHVENLEAGATYSYKIGSEAGWKRGTFTVEKENPSSVTAIQLSDAQTKYSGSLKYWVNTFNKSIETGAEEANGLDFVLYNGDQFDQNQSIKENGSTPKAQYRYAKALEVIQDAKGSIPYMPSSGNHEPSSDDILKEMQCIDAHSDDASGIYYSFDYGPAHFTVVNSNKAKNIDISDEQLAWIKEDLSSTSKTWKIVMMHAGAYATGDHCGKGDNTKLVEKLTPVFSANHVDLVLQAHEHTYNKTLAYKWDLETPYQRKDDDTADEADIVNLEPETKILGGRLYDKNPNGTYYVTTGAAGGRVAEGYNSQGKSEGDAGIYAEVVRDPATNNWVALDPTYSYLSYDSNKSKNPYKVLNGSITENNVYHPFTCSDPAYTSAQVYHEGDLASADVNAQMFGVLNIDETTLRYDFYTVDTYKASKVELFDSLNVYKGA